jgi:hypothetical protein
LVLDLVWAITAARRSVATDTTATIPTGVRPTVTTDRVGSLGESSSARALGITDSAGDAVGVGGDPVGVGVVVAGEATDLTVADGAGDGTEVFSAAVPVASMAVFTEEAASTVGVVCTPAVGTVADIANPARS